MTDCFSSLADFVTLVKELPGGGIKRRQLVQLIEMRN
jgi:hypothetical protein